MQPIVIMKHERRAKANCVPILEIIINTLCLGQKTFLIGIELTIMMKVVDAYLKAPIDKPGSKISWHYVISFGNEIEGRSKTELKLHFRQLLDPINAPLTFDIVRQHDGKAPSHRANRAIPPVVIQSLVLLARYRSFVSGCGEHDSVSSSREAAPELAVSNDSRGGVLRACERKSFAAATVKQSQSEARR